MFATRHCFDGYIGPQGTFDLSRNAFDKVPAADGEDFEAPDRLVLVLLFEYFLQKRCIWGAGDSLLHFILSASSLHNDLLLMLSITPRGSPDYRMWGIQLQQVV